MKMAHFGVISASFALRPASDMPHEEGSSSGRGETRKKTLRIYLVFKEQTAPGDGNTRKAFLRVPRHKLGLRTED